MSSISSILSDSTHIIPVIPDDSSSLQWITLYLKQRMLSRSSWVYAWSFWIVMASVFFSYACLRWAGLRSGYLGALWSKWALRRRTWRKKHSLAVAQRSGQPHRQPMSLPSNAQILVVVFLFVSTFILTFVGPDYIAPGGFIIQPQFTIGKSWWTSGGRAGMMAFALFPLVVLLALKASPFALLSLPYFVHLSFDKLAFLHRWCAFLVWLLTTLHVVLWSIQLGIDRRPSTGKIAYEYIWQYEKFIFAWIGYGCFTLLMISALPPVRRRHFEVFHFLHILLVPLTLILSALHHPPLQWWCWTALSFWIGERCYRATWWLHINGFAGGMQPSSLLAKGPKELPRKSEVNSGPLPMHLLGQANALGNLPKLPRLDISTRAVSMAGANYVPPPGFVHAELLPGKTVRIRLLTPGFISWAPGQHFLFTIPSINPLVSHPFTSASVCDSRAHDLGRELVFFIRAKKGWTKDLWTTVANMTAQGLKLPKGEKIPVQYRLPARGVLMRGFVDGSFGSAARARWGDHSTVLLIAGGSGVSFSLSILQYICMCMAGRDGRDLGGLPGGFGKRNFRTQRVRFVWIVREFGHVHWCAQVLRRCMTMVSPSELQIDIFVTNSQPMMKSISMGPPVTNALALVSQDPLLPPASPFVVEELRVDQNPQNPNFLRGSLESEADGYVVDLSYYASDIAAEGKGELGHDEHVLDLTNFEDDDDTALPGEYELNAAVKQEGTVRRSFWRRKTRALVLGPRTSSEKRSASIPRTSIERPTVRLVTERPQSRAMQSLSNNPGHSPVRSRVYSPAGGLTPPKSAVPLLSVPEDDATTRFVFPTLPTPSSTTSSVPTPSRTPSPPQVGDRPSIASLRPESTISVWSDVNSLAALVSEAAAQDQIRLELTEEEMADISIVAERARAGRPVFNRILEDEVERAKGSVIVGCCGPTSLNAVVRKNIAAQIDPERIRRGDQRGHIALVAEDFGY